MARTAHFSPELFAFLRELRQNNRRAWFQTNKERYESHVREPMLQFISDFGPRLATISPHFTADPRPVGGSLFRIYRDTRFSRDKTAYKTTVGAQFRHEQAVKDVHAPGFYLHLEPDGVFAACGLWRPESALLRRVRDTIADDPARWERAISDEAFQATYDLTGNTLRRPPVEYDPTHPFIEDLKRKDFIATTLLSEEEVLAVDFIDHYTDLCRISSPFMAFLATAAGFPW